MVSAAVLEMHRRHKERRARLDAQAKQRVVLVSAVNRLNCTEQPVEPTPEPEIEPDPLPPIPGAEKAFVALKVKQIVQAVEEHCRLFPGDLFTERRWQKLVIPRQVAMFLIYRHTKHATPGIGKIFNRDHSTVVYAVHKIHDLVEQGDDQVIGIIHAVSLRTNLPTYSYWGS